MAAVLPGKGAPLQVTAFPYTPPGPGEIVVRNHAVAMNPVDWGKQIMGDSLFPWIKYPFVLGQDAAGVVVEVGPGVTRFAVGDRVLGHAVGADPKRNSAAEGAFQLYTVLMENMAAPIPESMSYAAASVVPLGASTAACALFQKDQLALHYPSALPTRRNATVLIWGGATSVGSNAIQLARAAGYDVISTASPKNFDYVKRLGANRVFDYNDRHVVRDIIASLHGKTIAGALAIGKTAGPACLDIAAACTGNRFVSMISYPIDLNDSATGVRRMFTMARGMIGLNVNAVMKRLISGVRMKFVFGSSLLGNEVGPLLYREFLPGALEQGQFTPTPEPRVAGHGLEAIQAALNVQRRGVSASKVVVTLEP